jgi:hypothetical protein
VDSQDIFRKIATSQGLSVMLAERKGIFIQIVLINQLEEGRITVEAVEPHLEVGELHIKQISIPMWRLEFNSIP